MSEIKTRVFTSSDVLACDSVHCADQRQHSIPDFLLKSIDNTQQTCVDVANEYLQAYNTGADVKNHLFGSVCINVNKQVIQCFCVHLFCLTNFFEIIDNDTFAVINTQPSNMQGELWIMIANFRQDFGVCCNRS